MPKVYKNIPKYTQNVPKVFPKYIQSTESTPNTFPLANGIGSPGFDFYINSAHSWSHFRTH